MKTPPGRRIGRQRRVHAQLPEDVSPDGIALVAESAGWLANPEDTFGVMRVRKGGEIVERGDAFIIILDIDKVFSSDELSLVQDAEKFGAQGTGYRQKRPGNRQGYASGRHAIDT